MFKLKGRSIWDVQKDNNDSWMWKSLLDLRGKVKNSIWKVIGDGKSTNIWHDQWCHLGALDNIVSKRDMYNERLHNNMTINEMVDNGSWQ